MARPKVPSLFEGHSEDSTRMDEGGVVIRLSECRTILNRTSISDYSLNCYTGCAHGCVYCYARYMQRFHPHPEPWGGFVDVKVNAVDVLRRQLRGTKPGNVFVSSACDGWQPVEARMRLTRRCCELLLEYGFILFILTKSALLLRDLNIFSGKGATIGVTITTLDERLRRLWEPGGASIDERFKVIEEARRAGLQTEIMFGPILPFLSDSQESIDSMLERSAELGVHTIRVDTLNPRPRVWPSVEGLLNRNFPDLICHYRRIMFDKRSRGEYMKRLRDRLAIGAGKFSLHDRVALCF